MPGTIDLTGDENEKTRRMLREETIAWFTTVSADGRPHAVPVWVLWFDDRVIVFSQPGTVKVAHVRAGSPVLVHLNAGGPHGDDVVILEGRAEVSDRPSSAWLEDFGEEYFRKYSDAIEAFGMSAGDIAERYSAALVFTPEKLLAW
jgi:PPOX class probable F420-dependent enzyme